MPTPFEIKVNEQIARLQNSSMPAIEAEVAHKRAAWFLGRSELKKQAGLSPRQAYELLFFDYMGLSSADLPVIKETPDEIVWQSRNPCPTLAACLQLGLDTRQVCRGAYEKSTQVFLSQVDPQLRFLRSYAEIRPHAPFCLERIVRVNFKAMMALALSQAQLSQRAGGPPFGAVIVRGSQILAQAHATLNSHSDPDQHADVNAIHQAVSAAGDPNLSGCILFSTVEPCPVCISLAMDANLTSIVYGVPSTMQSAPETGPGGVPSSIGYTMPGLIQQPSPVLLEMIGGVLADEYG